MIKVVESGDKDKFEDEVNDLLNDGWKLISTNCGFANSEEYDFCSVYQAILKRRPYKISLYDFCGYKSVRIHQGKKLVEEYQYENSTVKQIVEELMDKYQIKSDAIMRAATALSRIATNCRD